jgi:hypothetical protein
MTGASRSCPDRRAARRRQVTEVDELALLEPWGLAYNGGGLRK